MASLPPKPQGAEAARLESASSIGKAGATLNRVAKRDPSLYPLMAIVGGIFCFGGYYLTSKGQNVDPAKAFMSGQAVNPWDDSSKHDTHPSQVAAFKYRYKNRQGVMEDSLPVLNEDVRTISSQAAPKFRTDL